MFYARFAAVFGALLLSSASARAASTPDLDEVFRAAVASPSVVASVGQSRVAESARVGAGLAPLLNPTLSLGGGYAASAPGPLFDASLTVPFEIANQRGQRLAEASRLSAWKRASIEVASVEAGAEAVLAYGGWVVAAAREEESGRGKAAADADAKAIEARVAAADATAYDLSLARAEAARWAQLNAEAKIARDAAATRVRELTALDLGAASAPPASVPALRGGRAFSAERSPALRELEDERRYWESSRDRWARERVPPIGIAVTGGRGELGDARVGGALVFVLPMTRRYQGEIATADAERERVAGTRDALGRALAARAEGALRVYDGAVAALAEIDQGGLPATEMAVDSAMAAYRAGKVELSRVLLARRDASAMRARRLDLIETAWRAYAELTTLQGGLP